MSGIGVPKSNFRQLCVVEARRVPRYHFVGCIVCGELVSPSAISLGRVLSSCLHDVSRPYQYWFKIS